MSIREIVGFFVVWLLLGTAEAQECAYACGKGESCKDLSQTLGDSRDSGGSCIAEVAPWLTLKDCHSTPKEDRSWHLGCGIFWRGEITNERVELLESVVNQLPNRPNNWEPNKYGQKFFFRMQSEGGDVDAALKLGRLLRKNKASMWVWDYCASACVYVLAGAVKRSIADDAVVAIHRPYRVSGVSIGMEQAQDQFVQRVNKIKDYLQEVNVPDQLVDAQVAVPFNESRTLSRSELGYYLLDGIDPVFQEEVDASEAQKRNISMLEYMERKRRRDKCVEDVLSHNQRVTDLSDFRWPKKDCDHLLDTP